MISVAIAILNWNQPQLTINTIDSVLNIDHPGFDYHIFLLDNGSTDNSLQVLTKKYSRHPQVTISTSPNNLGFGTGNNYIVKIALKTQPDYVLLLNNDVKVDQKFLSTLVSYSQKNPGSGLISPKIYFAPGYEFHHERYQKNELGKVVWFMGAQIDWNNINGFHRGVNDIDNGQYDAVYTDSDYLTGCCLLIKTAIINQIGLFDDDYYMYLEDADLCQRAVAAGYSLTVVPQSYIWHLNAGSSGVGSGLQDYFLTRNRLLFGFKYASLRTKFALFRESLRKFISTPSKWQRQGIVDFYLRKFNRGSWQ